MRLLGGRRVRLVGGMVLASVIVLLAARVAARLYYDPALWAVAGWSVTPDFEVFFQAAQDIVAGRTPYEDVDSIENHLGYVYPPLLAIAITPLSILPLNIAISLWALFSGFCVIGALYMLGVRDWRCYPVALLWPFNREAIEFGAIGPLLLLVVAACWRYRDYPRGASSAAGCAAALKLFLWPLALWLGFTGRTKAAGLSIVVVVTLVFVPWAAIGFEGLVQYPALLHEVAEQQDRSYSLVALARTVGLGAALAEVLSLAFGLALLALAFLAARDDGNGARERDRRSLTFTLAASLVLTPVVWTHYLVLLLAPVALARPRLSGLWLVPLGATILYVFDWYRPSPEGDLLPLVAATALAAATFAGSLRHRDQMPNAARGARTRA